MQIREKRRENVLDAQAKRRHAMANEKTKQKVKQQTK